MCVYIINTTGLILEERDKMDATTVVEKGKEYTTWPPHPARIFEKIQKR